MYYFIYDGTFEGLLTAIYETFYSQKLPDLIITRAKYNPDLFAKELIITTDQEKSDKVYSAVRDKISPDALQNIFYAYLSELEKIELAIYHYLKIGFKFGAKVDNYLTDDQVMSIHHAVRKVKIECHKLTGFVRFQQLKNNVYYAPIEPDHNILCLLAPHFSARLADQNWIIHDLRRKVAAIYNLKEWVITPVDVPTQLHYADDEEIYQKIWQEFFSTIAIKERLNPALQRNHIPVRYWRHLVEKMGKL